MSESPEINAFSEDMWGEGGGLAYVQAANRMMRNHPQSEYLDERDRRALALVFGELTHQIQVHWDAVPLNEWASDRFGIQMVGEEAEAQTYGYHVYMRGPKSSWVDEHRLETLIHEITHTEQFIQYGSSLQSFGNIYFREYFRAGQDYDANRLEVEARVKAETWLKIVLAEFQKNS